MTKPQMIRADTIDLQDHSSPSAKDHTRQPTSPGAIGEGPPAPHQANHLRHASLDEHSLSSRSPRASQDLSNKELQLLHDQHATDDDDDNDSGDEREVAELNQSLGVSRNGDLTAGANGQDAEGDGEDDESLEDDMMDKISSSPSIDDGGLNLSSEVAAGGARDRWPARGDSLFALDFTFPLVSNGKAVLLQDSDGDGDEGGAPLASSSCPCTSPPLHLPLASSPVPKEEEDRDPYTDSDSDRSVPSEFSECPESPDELLSWSPPLLPLPRSPTPDLPAYPMFREDSMETRDRLMPMVTESFSDYMEELGGETYDADFEDGISGLEGLLVPLDDPLLDNRFDTIVARSSRALPPIPRDGGHSEKEPGPGDRMLGEDECSEEEEQDMDDDIDDAFFEDERFVDSGWGGTCLRETEDIDFEFVYALHTFVATVEGQANATKGDTMVLLDDSNSYWWLVRVVKDSSIGYLPAEHIETPTERLARLNKHRNIDLSQTMLGDNPERSRNPLKKAMRRRNAKTVQFAEPTYYEASEVEYSTEDENDSELEYGGSEVSREDAKDQQQQQQQEEAQERQEERERRKQEQERQQREQIEDRSTHVEPLAKGRAPKENGIDDAVSESTTLVNSKADTRDDKPRNSSDVSEAQPDDTVQGSKRRMRNTDSFYKDESIETRKITLTPNLLREEAPNSQNNSFQQDKIRASLEGSEKSASLDKSRDEKEKEKDKKPSKFSKIFGRNKDKKKDKKSKAEEDDDWIKDAKNGRSSPQPKTSSDNISLDKDAQSSPQKSQPTRQTSKLQKQPPSKQGSLRKAEPREEPRPQPRQELVSTKAPRVESALIPDGALSNPFEDPDSSFNAEQDVSKQMPSPSQPPPSQAQPQMQAVRPALQPLSSDVPIKSTEVSTEFASPTSENSLRNVFSPIREALRPNAAIEEPPKAERVKKAKNRMALDDSDDSDDEQQLHADTVSQFPSAPQRQPQFDNNTLHPHSAPSKDRLSESPVQVSPVLGPVSHPPALVGDSSSHDEDHEPVSPVSPSSTPELIERPIYTPTTTNPSTPTASTAGATRIDTSNLPSAPTPQPPGAFSPTLEPMYPSSYQQPQQQTQAQPAQSQHQRTPPLQQTPQHGHNASTTTAGFSAASASTTPVSSRTHQSETSAAWSDANLRQYLETATEEIRDLLMVVGDTSDVVVDKEDPNVRKFEGDLERFRSIERRLDRMVVELCARHGV